MFSLTALKRCSVGLKIIAHHLNQFSVAYIVQCWHDHAFGIKWSWNLNFWLKFAVRALNLVSVPNFNSIWQKAKSRNLGLDRCRKLE